MPDHTPESSKRSRGAYSRLICLGCRERRIKCELPNDVVVPDPGELQTTQTPCYRCKKLGVPCVVRRTRLGRPGPGDGSTTSLPAAVQDQTRPGASSAIDLPLGWGYHRSEWSDGLVPLHQLDSSSNGTPPLADPRSRGTHHLGQSTTSVSDISPNLSVPGEPHAINPAKVHILPLRRSPVLNKSPATSEDASSSGDGQVITTKRTRASKPKVRTGCLTCKIRRVVTVFSTSSLASLTFSLRSSAMKLSLLVKNAKVPGGSVTATLRKI